MSDRYRLVKVCSHGDKCIVCVPPFGPSPADWQAIVDAVEKREPSFAIASIARDAVRNMREAER